MAGSKNNVETTFRQKEGQEVHCKFYQTGYCKFKENCTKKHEHGMCEDQNNCKEK